MPSLRLVVILLAALAVSGCHFAHHVPPGQAKKLIAPPPGQAKKIHWQ